MISDIPVFKDFKLDHIGIAVESMDEGSKFYKALGFTSLYSEVVESQKVKVGMYELANGSRIELLEPTSEDSPIAKFLKKRGPGIHHVCLEVKHIESALEDLKKAGVLLINEKPVPGAHNCLVAFVHPASAGGVLVELSQKQ